MNRKEFFTAAVIFSLGLSISAQLGERNREKGPGEANPIIYGGFKITAVMGELQPGLPAARLSQFGQVAEQAGKPVEAIITVENPEPEERALTIPLAFLKVSSNRMSRVLPPPKPYKQEYLQVELKGKTKQTYNVRVIDEIKPDPVPGRRKGFLNGTQYIISILPQEGVREGKIQLLTYSDSDLSLGTR